MRDLRPPAFIESTRRVDAGDGVFLVWPPDELVVAPGRPWIEHRCICGDGVEALTAVGLHPDHSVSGQFPTVTIKPSVPCPSCGLHGFVTNSMWRSC